MHFTTSVATALAVASLASASVIGGGNSIVAYWGQGNVNIPLSDVCSNPNIDIVVLSFVNVFPDQSASGWPGTNFGSSCGGQVFQKDGVDTQLLDGAHCGTMIPDIADCQTAGKKVLLSLAGGFPTDQWLHNDTSAVSFADFLIGAFGQPTASWTGPRPIGASHVDGFDFDIESNLFGVNPTYPGVIPAGTTFPDYMSRGYAAMANHIHGAGYLTSSAPQCQIPDAHLGPALSAAWFDYVFVQFYNTPGCSAMDFIQGTGSFNYASWASATYINPATMVYIGLPASTDSANAGYYLTPTQVHTLLTSFTSNLHFGGVMLWEATASARNLICGKDYAWWVRQALNACFTIGGGTFSEVCPSSSSSSSIASSTSSVASSTSSSISITSSSSSSIVSSSSSSSLSSSASSSSSSSITSSASSSSSSDISSSASSSSSSSISSTASSSSSSDISSSSSTWTSSSIPASPTITSSSSTSSDISSSSSTWSPTITSSASSSSSSDVSSSSSLSTDSSSSSGSSSDSSSSSASSTESSSSLSTSSSLFSSASSTESSSSLSTSSYTSSSASSIDSSSSYSTSSSTPGSPVLPSTTSSTYSSSSYSSSSDVTSSSSSYSSFSYYPNSTYTTATSSTPDSPVIPSTTSSEYYPSSSSSSEYYPYDDPSTTTSSSSASSSSVYYYDDPSTTSSTSSVFYYDDPSTTSSTSSVFYYDDPSSSTPVKPTVTSKPYYSYDDPSYTSTSVYTTTITTTYVDVCPTGLTTVTATYKTTVCPGSTTPAVPVGWTTTVTVCKNCGPKPTTITITKPYVASTAVEIVTLVVKPVPEKEYYSSLSTVVVPSVPAAPVKAAPSAPAAPVKAAPSYPVAPVVASSYPVAPVAPSSSPVSPVKPITYAAASGYAAPTGSKTGYPAAQFTGAASRVNVGVGAFIGLIIAALAAM